MKNQHSDLTLFRIGLLVHLRIIPRADLSSECTHQYYQIDLLYFILTSFFLFLLYGAVVSALRALLHPLRLL